MLNVGFLRSVRECVRAPGSFPVASIFFLRETARTWIREAEGEEVKVKV